VGVCAGIRRSGGRCTVSVEPGQTYCHHHDPARADERRRAASRAGKSKPSQEIKDIKRQLEDLAADVLAGNVERGDAVVVNQILNTRARLIELERKVKETDELEARLEALEQVQEQRGGSKWRGA
jgi:hypothetical protein